MLPVVVVKVDPEAETRAVRAEVVIAVLLPPLALVPLVAPAPALPVPIEAPLVMVIMEPVPVAEPEPPSGTVADPEVLAEERASVHLVSEEVRVNAPQAKTHCCSR